MTEMEIKEQICDVCHKMWQLGWVAANDGNVSVKLPDGNFICTPTGISKSFITPEKLVKINAQGEILEANDGYRPSSEMKMHMRCYELRDDVGAVVHAHPPAATGFAVAHLPMDRLKWERNFIVPNSNVNISSYEGEILGVILPDKATLKVVECEQAVKGDTATSASKNAVLETGLEVKVPLFINQDEMIVVNTNDGKYSGRAK